MNKKEAEMNIGNWEMAALVILILCTKIFLSFPRLMAESAGQAGWILSIYVSLITITVFWFMLRLYKKHYGKDLIDLGEHIGGAAGRIFVGLIIIGFTIYVNSVILREFSEDMKIISLSISPISFVSLFFLAAMIISAYVGLEALVRMNAIAVPIISLGYIIIMLGVGRYYDLSKIMPLFGLGFKQIFINGITRISIFSELLIVFMLTPNLKKFNNFKKSTYIGIVISSVFLTISSLVYLLVFAYPHATESFLPIYQLARLVDYGSFFQRGESVFLLIWAVAAMLYLSLGFNVLLQSFKKTFKLDHYKPLILPFAVIIFTLSLMPPNLMSVIELDTGYLRKWGFIISFGFAILLFVLAGLKKTKKKGEAH